MVHAVNRATALSRALDFRFMGNPGGAYIWNLSSTTPAFEQRRKRCLLSQASTKEDAGSDRGVLRLLSPWDASTEDIGRALTKYAKAGDCLCLFGSVGAGKSTFSRAFIRDLTGDDELTVASPTFMLKLIYDEHQGPPVHHFDLYRLSGPEDFKNLQLAKSFSEAVSLFEWPERLGDAAPKSRLDIRIHIIKPGHRLEATVNSHLIRFQATREEQQLQQSEESIEEEDVEMMDSEYIDTYARVLELTAHGARWESMMKALIADIETRACSPSAYSWIKL
eukprot:CAMPEP_0114235212 /NCGR_PEP_ID=MMETSP0058-20121206/6125_1 /TAXON_ID=36894 /ORGANISM="Pyramimonas parkeae, CCMP726" /LENGTH=278 /DNA_ID=CAMNT_0001346949 /DNA_START=214 /DNA_END=1050 /DNA_ORIENTATION=-